MMGMLLSQIKRTKAQNRKILKAMKNALLQRKKYHVWFTSETGGIRNLVHYHGNKHHTYTTWIDVRFWIFLLLRWSQFCNDGCIHSICISEVTDVIYTMLFRASRENYQGEINQPIWRAAYCDSTTIPSLIVSICPAKMITYVVM